MFIMALLSYIYTNICCVVCYVEDFEFDGIMCVVLVIGG